MGEGNPRQKKGRLEMLVNVGSESLLHGNVRTVSTLETLRWFSGVGVGILRMSKEDCIVRVSETNKQNNVLLTISVHALHMM